MQTSRAQWYRLSVVWCKSNAACLVYSLSMRKRALSNFDRVWIPLVEILPRHHERLIRGLRLRGVQSDVVRLVERDPVLRHVHEEVAAVGESIVHLSQRVDDEVDRRAQRLGDRQLVVQPLLELEPEGDAVG